MASVDIFGLGSDKKYIHLFIVGEPSLPALRHTQVSLHPMIILVGYLAVIVYSCILKQLFLNLAITPMTVAGATPLAVVKRLTLKQSFPPICLHDQTSPSEITVELPASIRPL